MKSIQFLPINDKGDIRGESYYIPDKAIEFIGNIDEMHYATILPSQIRGNHYHIGRREFIIIKSSDACIVSWREPNENFISTKEFKKNRVILILVEPQVIHAIKNTGKAPIHLVSCSNKRYDPDHPDTFREEILK